MGVFKDFKRLLTGDYITVRDVAYGYETTETDARERLNSLVDDEGVLKEIQKDMFVPADDVDADEMAREFNKKFSDLRSELTDELDYLEP